VAGVSRGVIEKITRKRFLIPTVLECFKSGEVRGFTALSRGRGMTEEQSSMCACVLECGDSFAALE
jgi:hypothetical protein